MSSSGDDEQSRANVPTGVGFEWQSELDSAMSDVDSRMLHPRRRASDVAAQPTLPQLGQFSVTSELLDEIAWRVAEQMRRTQAGAEPGTPPGAWSAPLEPVAPARAAMPEGIAIVIRLRRPLFSWKFWSRRSRRRQAMINFSDMRVS